MSIDLTKPIEAARGGLSNWFLRQADSHISIHIKDDRVSSHSPEDSFPITESDWEDIAYFVRIVQSAPKMLTWIEKAVDCELGTIAEEGRALIAAIEGTTSSSQPIDNEVAQLRAELTVSKAVQAQELDALQRVTSKE